VYKNESGRSINIGGYQFQKNGELFSGIIIERFAEAVSNKFLSLSEIGHNQASGTNGLEEEARNIAEAEAARETNEGRSAVEADQARKDAELAKQAKEARIAKETRKLERKAQKVVEAEILMRAEKDRLTAEAEKVRLAEESRLAAETDEAII
jgi:hypothetical protein